MAANSTIQVQITGGFHKEGAAGEPVVYEGRQVTVTDPFGFSMSGTTNAGGVASFTRPDPGWPSGRYTIALVALNDGEILTGIAGSTAGPVAYTFQSNYLATSPVGFGYTFKTAVLTTFYARNQCEGVGGNAVNPRWPVGVAFTVTGETGSFGIVGVSTPTQTVTARATCYLYSVVGIQSIALEGYQFSNGGETDLTGTFTVGGATYSVESLPVTFAVPEVAGTYWSCRLTEVGGCGAGAALAASLAKGPWCLQTREGWFHEAYVLASQGIRYRRSDFPVPPFAINGRVSSGTNDAEPRMVVRTGKQLVLLFTRPAGSVPNVYRSTSDDDGVTWSTPTVMFAGCKHPTLNVHPRSQRTLHGAFKVTTTGRGNLYGSLQESGDASPGAEFKLTKTGGGPIVIDDDTFHFAPAAESPLRWTLVAKDGGSIVRYYSTDDGRTWTLIP